MDEMIARSNGQPMGPRVPIGRRVAAISVEDHQERSWDLFPSRTLFSRSSSDSSDKCSDTSGANTCEKPTNTSVATEITVSVVIPIAVVFICCLIYFHRRNMKRQALEDTNPHHRSLDFGLGDASSDKSKKGKSGGGEKSKHPRGLSMDMNLSSPYLLPDAVHGSRESMSSLAKTLHQDDPYRPVTTYMSETGSIRSFEKTSRYTPSVMTASTKRMSRQSYANPMSPAFPQPPPRQNSYPKSPLTPSAASSVTAVDSDVQVPLPTKEPTVFENEPLPPPQGALPPVPTVPEIRQPEPAAQRDAPQPTIHIPEPHQELSEEPEAGLDMPDFSHNVKRESADELNLRSNVNTDSTIGLGLLNGPQAPPQSPPIIEVASSPNQEVSAGPAHQSVSAVIEHTEDYADFDYAAVVASTEEEDTGRGRSRVRESGLMVPQQSSKRLSIGLRPLPPDEMIESEDPETRANRIRSFYKEYFDDSKPAAPPAGDFQAGDAYGDAAYFDPDSNQFIMPYAQPIGRRAMTPPPSGSRFPGPRGPGGPGGPRGPGPRGPGGPGPRGPPRHHSGSISGMPRAGSAMSFGPRPGSSASARAPRSGSAMSGRPRKPMPPPSPLNTLPTPAMLKDDGLSLINAADFAPPESFGDRARGRSQSPMGERRAYGPKVPVASPLVSSFDEMAALPSPHLLRKSSTFTGLDFAPPKKFKDNDTMSDAGSIRSNRSGISRVNEMAIRNGAGRVSKLPEDMVFSQAQMELSLKPTMNMNNNY